ncbi:hypothetical protein BJ742DRAFT_816571 [Cladochytrium replicatum]|nr:hypothetical protein BJ742DRAFT_816571 [Cladochytrium replicatum]
MSRLSPKRCLSSLSQPARSTVAPPLNNIKSFDLESVVARPVDPRHDFELRMSRLRIQYAKEHADLQKRAKESADLLAASERQVAAQRAADVRAFKRRRDLDFANIAGDDRAQDINEWPAYISRRRQLRFQRHLVHTLGSQSDARAQSLLALYNASHSFVTYRNLEAKLAVFDGSEIQSSVSDLPQSIAVRKDKLRDVVGFSQTDDSLKGLEREAELVRIISGRPSPEESGVATVARHAQDLKNEIEKRGGHDAVKQKRLADISAIRDEIELDK